MTLQKKLEFRATLERMKSSLGWVIIRVPIDVSKAWGTRGQTRVRVQVNGAEFRTSLFPSGTGQHYMIVNKQMQRAGGARIGAAADFVMEKDSAKRGVALPAELNRILRQDRALKRYFNGLTHSTRNDISRWVSEPKTELSRNRRAEQIAERLLETMEAEIELPPLIRNALARNPLAYDGWQLMTAVQRRSHLFGIFYYRTPEARARRLEKALDAAAQLIKKRNTG